MTVAIRGIELLQDPSLSGPNGAAARLGIKRPTLYFRMHDRFLPGPLEMTRFLRSAVGTARALSGVHIRQLIHQDVKPANGLFNSTTGHVRLMNFDIASRLPRERIHKI